MDSDINMNNKQNYQIDDDHDDRYDSVNNNNNKLNII